MVIEVEQRKLLWWNVRKGTSIIETMRMKHMCHLLIMSEEKVAHDGETQGEVRRLIVFTVFHSYRGFATCVRGDDR